MSHLMYGYRRHQLGAIEHRVFDSADFPKGWYDAPDKVPPMPGKGEDSLTAAARGDVEASLSPSEVNDQARSVMAAVRAQKGVCPNCGKHIGRGLAFHVKRCKAPA